MPTNSRHTTPAILLALAGLCGLAAADTPAVLDHVPADAAIVVTIGNISELLEDVVRINGSMGEHGNPMLPMIIGMAAGTPGLNMNGSIAFVVDDLDPEFFEPTGISIILPVTDMDALVQQLGAIPNDGTVELNLQGQTMFMRSIGNGFACLGQTQESVEGYDGGAGKMAANEARLGANGNEIVSSSDITVMIDISKLAPVFEPKIDELLAQAAEQLAAMPDAPQGMPMDMVGHMLKQFASDASLSVLAVNADEMGIGLNFATQFKAQTELANFFGQEADSHSLLGHVPAGPYLFAAAADFEWTGFQMLTQALDLLMEQAEQTQPEMMAQFGKMDIGTMMENATGYAQVLSVNPNGMQDGLIKNSVTYLAGSDPKALAAFQADAAMMSDGVATGGVMISATHDAKATTIDGVELDSYSTTFSADQNSMTGGPSPVMFMQMLFGADMGPKGYIGAVESGVIQTTTQDEQYVAASISAAKNGNGLSESEDIKAIASKLPSGRFFEAYIAANHLLNDVGPMLAMFGMLDAFEPIDGMSPVAFGVSGHSGGFNFGTFVPMEAIKVGVGLVPANPGLTEPANEDPEF